MGRCLDELADCGALGVEWTVLDAQHFGVPQRRRRVFIVAWFDPRIGSADPLLPVASRCQGHPQPGTTQGQDVAGAVGVGTGSVGEVAGTLGTRTGGGRTTDLDSVGAYVIERERDGGCAPDPDRGTVRSRGAGWAPDRAAPVLSGEGRGYRNDVDGTTWVIQ